MCHFWALVTLFLLSSYISYTRSFTSYSLFFAILITSRDISSYISRAQISLDLRFQCNLSKIVFFSLNPIFLGQGYFLWSPVISCKGPFSSSLPCSVSGTLSSDPLVSLLCFLIYLDNFLGIHEFPVHVSGVR